jgi:hypothetical protein
LGNNKYHQMPQDEWLTRLYLIYEVDTEYPRRLDAWLERQSRIGSIETKYSFGGITVARVHRFTLIK